MNPADLIALAERCEQATGPDRELDRDVILALHPEAQISEYCVGDEEWLVFHAEPLIRNKTKLPAFTSSLDAAMRLPGPVIRRLEWLGDAVEAELLRAPGILLFASAPTAPQAIVSVKLRALAAQVTK